MEWPKYILLGMNERMDLPRVMCASDKEDAVYQKMVDSMATQSGMSYKVYSMSAKKKRWD